MTDMGVLHSIRYFQYIPYYVQCVNDITSMLMQSASQVPAVNYFTLLHFTNMLRVSNCWH